MSLLISNSQLDAMAAVLEEWENRQLLHYAMERFPDIIVAGSAEYTVEWIQSVRRAAGRYGIRNGKNVAAFTDLTVMYGPDFGESDWARNTLRSAAFSEFEKINILKQQIEDQGIFI